MGLAGPKAEPPCGGCPLVHPPPLRPCSGPEPPCPTRMGSRCRKPDTTGFVFWASPPPRRPLQPQGADATTRPCSRGGRATAGGTRRGAEAGAAGTAGTQRALCEAAQRLRPCTHAQGRGTGPRHPGAQGSGGDCLGHLSCGFGQGSHSRPEGKLVTCGPLWSSPGPSPPQRDERGTRLTACSKMAQGQGGAPVVVVIPLPNPVAPVGKLVTQLHSGVACFGLER